MVTSRIRVTECVRSLLATDRRIAVGTLWLMLAACSSDPVGAGEMADAGSDAGTCAFPADLDGVDSFELDVLNRFAPPMRNACEGQDARFVWHRLDGRLTATQCRAPDEEENDGGADAGLAPATVTTTERVLTEAESLTLQELVRALEPSRNDWTDCPRIVLRLKDAGGAILEEYAPNCYARGEQNAVEYLGLTKLDAALTSLSQ